MTKARTNPPLERLTETLRFHDEYEFRVKEAADCIGRHVRKRFHGQTPEFGVVLGSGLGDLADQITDPVVVDYSKIPSFPRPTVHGHAGKVCIGELEGVPIIGLQGRKHFYEVATEPFNTGMLQVVFPVHVVAELGVRNYFVTNAAGGLNPRYEIGRVMVIKSHINLIPNALLGRHHGFRRIDNREPTWRFQPMNDAYDDGLRSMLADAAASNDAYTGEGIYLAVTGPTYETVGECLTFRDGWKADAVGMSTAPEVIVARNRGMRCVGFSCITNKIDKDGVNATNHEEVTAVLNSQKTRDSLSGTVLEFFDRYKRMDR